MIAFLLAGGRGAQVRPLTVKAGGYLRPKAAMSLCGRRLIHWVVASMREQGIRDFVMVTQGKQNRHQVMALLGFGEDLGVRVRYSQP